MLRDFPRGYFKGILLRIGPYFHYKAVAPDGNVFCSLILQFYFQKSIIGDAKAI